MIPPVAFAALSIPCIALPAAEPLRVHPDNLHYLLFRGKPAILIGSGEHSGAVLSLDIGSIPYLECLKRRASS